MKVVGLLGVAWLSLVSLVCLTGRPLHADDDESDHSWKFAGGGIQDAHSTRTANALDPANVPALTLKWLFAASGNISATPTVEGDAVYIVDWGGRIFRLDKHSGLMIWSHSVSEYTGNPASVSRTSPAIGRHAIVFGDQAGGTVIAVDKGTGAMLWKTAVDPLPASSITGAPVIFNDRVYVGVSSQEEVLAFTQPGYVPSFRGKVAALDLKTGALVWQFTTVPTGYTGGAVWGSSPAVDKKRRSLYVATGNNYTVPPAAAACLDVIETIPEQIACLDPANYEDAILSLDLDDGHLKWIYRTQGSDTFTVLCIRQPGSCVDPDPDFDVGAGPNFFALGHDGLDREDDHRQSSDILGVGSKSGMYFALDPDNGKLRWVTAVGPGGTFGGIQWGTAADGERVYVAITNSLHTQYKLEPNGPIWNAGSWSALDAATGTILWQTAATGQDPDAPAFPALALGSVSVANGVMYASSNAGDMVALDGASGRILWKFASGGTVLGGPAIVDDTLYWGSGYRKNNRGIPNNKLYAFSVVRRHR